MNITVNELKFLSNSIKTDKKGKIKYKNRYWKWEDNNKETIEISKDNKIWRKPKGIELKIINIL